MKPIIVLGAVLCALAYSSAWADEYLTDYYQPEAYLGYAEFTAEELDDLLAPIALYPDPLIAQILPAASFIDQIDEAARYVREYGKNAPIDAQPWDVSVKAVAHYPRILFLMDRKHEWTISLGQAFVNQEQDVMDSIQRLRDAARSAGSLTSTPQQHVIIEGPIIRILPARPEVIYIPDYDPAAVYSDVLYPAYGFIDFGIGFSIGAWLNRDCDWHRNRIYYHGWRGGGWINRARPYINFRNRTYVNPRHRDITINRRVVQQNNFRFRNDLRRDIQLRREQGVTRTPPGGIPQPRTRISPPVTSPPRSSTPPSGSGGLERRNIYRGRQSQGGGTAPYSGVGGYGSNAETNSYRQRGRMSRDAVRQPGGQRVAPSAPSSPGAPRIQVPHAAPAIPGMQQAPGGVPAAPGSGRRR